jgi:hypothetical protein
MDASLRVTQWVVRARAKPRLSTGAITHWVTAPSGAMGSVETALVARLMSWKKVATCFSSASQFVADEHRGGR